nr:retrovirus-related Pol polyprotein from transposon TNT 1-94 [Tanacetum cinerariifolium]
VKGTLIEAARTMLADSLLPIPFRAEAVNTACYVQNRVLVTKPHNKTPYELLHGRLPSIGFMRPFGCPVTILNTLNPLGKFQGKVDEGFLVGYSVNSKAFRVFNSRTHIVQETLHVNFMENKPNVAGSGPAWLFDIDSLSQTMNYHPSVSPDIHSSSCGNQTREQGDKTENKDKGKSPVVNITGFRDLNEEFTECINTSSNGVNAAGSLVFAAGLNFTNSTNDLSAAGPSNAAIPNLEDLSHNTDDVGAEADINNMESIIPKVWILVNLPYRKRAIGTKWVYRNKKDERGIVIRNKARLVAQGHTQEEGIDYEEVFAHVARIEAIRLFLAYASFMGFPVYQMDVKSAFLYVTIEEEVYVCKFQGKVDEGFLVGYSVCSKAFRVFNSRTRIVQETLHVNFMENKPNVAGFGPDWLFDIDSLTMTMNYHPVIAANQTNSNAGFQDTEKAGEEGTQTYMLFLVLSDDDVGVEADINNLESIISEEGIDYEEVFAPVARIKAIRLFLAYASFMGFLVYQMVVKSTFLYGTIEEEVYVYQPPGFKDPENPDKVYKVVKALYGLHQAPRAWYETLATYLLENGFQRVTIDQTLFIKKQQKDILLVQIYVDDIIFGATNKALCQSFEKLMKDKFQMSSKGELTFFLGLQVKQNNDGIFISQDKYVAEILKKFGLSERQSASTPIDAEKPLLKDSEGEDVDVHAYRSMIGSLMYLTSSRPDIMFTVCACTRFQQCKKQIVVATSSTEAEYVAATSGCAQVL